MTDARKRLNDEAEKAFLLLTNEDLPAVDWKPSARGALLVTAVLARPELVLRALIASEGWDAIYAIVRANETSR